MIGGNYHFWLRLCVFVCWPAVLAALVVLMVILWPLVWFGRILKEGDGYEFKFLGDE